MTRIARVSLLAMKRLGLDRVWWLVTPGNPLKDTRGAARRSTNASRAARALAAHPRIDVTGLEAVIGTRYTYDTIAIWLRTLSGRALRLDHGRRQSAKLSIAGRTGASIAALLPIAVVDRGGIEPLRRRRAPPQALGARPRPRSERPRPCPAASPPAWVYLHGLKSPLSSTALRAGEKAGRQEVETHRPSVPII